jgi:hypothetical protein
MFIRHSACAEARCCHDARIPGSVVCQMELVSFGAGLKIECPSAVEHLLCLYVYIT